MGAWDLTSRRGFGRGWAVQEFIIFITCMHSDSFILCGIPSIRYQVYQMESFLTGCNVYGGRRRAHTVYLYNYVYMSHVLLSATVCV